MNEYSELWRKTPWTKQDLCDRCRYFTVPPSCEATTTGTCPPSVGCWAWRPNEKRRDVLDVMEKIRKGFKVGDKVIVKESQRDFWYSLGNRGIGGIGPFEVLDIIDVPDEDLESVGHHQWLVLDYDLAPNIVHRTSGQWFEKYK